MRRQRVLSFRTNGGWNGHQVLQERRWWGWKTVDREEIPAAAIVSLGCLGDSGGWTSRFADVIERTSRPTSPIRA